MSPDITLGEVKACCEEMYKECGDACCDHCKYTNLGCCDAPESWKVDATPVQSRPNWEEMYKRQVEDNVKLRTIVSTIETMLGRKFNDI